VSTNEVIEASAEEEVLARGVPLDNADTALVTLQHNHCITRALCQTTIRNLPHADSAVLRGRRDDVIVERAPLEIQNRSLVTPNHREVLVEAAILTST
jgi:hypothetical protein